MPQIEEDEEEVEKQKEVADENKRKQSKNKNKNAPHVCQKLKFTTPTSTAAGSVASLFGKSFRRAANRPSPSWAWYRRNEQGRSRAAGGGEILFVHCLGGIASAFGQKFR